MESNSGKKLHVHRLWVIALKTATLECVLTSQKAINCFVYSKSVRSKIPTPPLNSKKNLMQSLSSKSFIERIFYKIQSELHQDPDCILLNSVEKKFIMLLLHPARAQWVDSVVVGLCLFWLLLEKFKAAQWPCPAYDY